MSEALKKKEKEFHWINKSITWKTIESERRGERREIWEQPSRERERLYRRPFGFGTRSRSASKWDGSSAPELFAC